MAELVDPLEIETLVGARRHESEHWGRASSEDEIVYILHSKNCLNSGIDLRACLFSIALYRGIIEPPSCWAAWEQNQDKPVLLRISGGHVVPA